MEFPELTDEERAALNGEVLETEVVEEEEAVEETPEETPAEEVPAEKPVEKPVEAPPPPEDKGAWAKMRYEASEAKREAERLRVENEALKNPTKVIPNREENYEGYIEGRVETQEERLDRLEKAEAVRQSEAAEKTKYNGAISELKQYESEYAIAAPDYNDASAYLKGLIATSIKVQNPGINAEDLAKKTIDTYVGHAAQAVRNGQHPAQALYKYALDFGYKNEPKEQEQEVKSNLSTVAANKKKSSGMLGASGSGGKGQTTKESAVKMSNAEFSRLSPEETDRLLYGS